MAASNGLAPLKVVFEVQVCYKAALQRSTTKDVKVFFFYIILEHNKVIHLRGGETI